MKKADRSLKKMDRLELLQLLVEQGEELERTQEALKAAEARAAHQERIARMAEDAVSKLAGILEAAQMHQETYSRRLKDLKTEMGLKTETVFNAASADSPASDPLAQSIASIEDPLSASLPQQATGIEDFDADDFVANTLGISASGDSLDDSFGANLPDFAPLSQDFIEDTTGLEDNAPVPSIALNEYIPDPDLEGVIARE